MPCRDEFTNYFFLKRHADGAGGDPKTWRFTRPPPAHAQPPGASHKAAVQKLAVCAASEHYITCGRDGTAKCVNLD